MTLNDLWSRSFKGHANFNVIHFGTNRFLVYDFLYAVNSNFCSKTHRLATIHNVTYDRQTDARTQRCSISTTVSTVG